MPVHRLAGLTGGTKSHHPVVVTRSWILYLVSNIQYRESSIQNPVSRIQDPVSSIQNREPRTLTMPTFFQRFEFFIGARYLRSRQKTAFVSLITFLSMIGVAVGVMTLMVVLAVMTGYEHSLVSRILGVESHVLVFRYGGAIADHQTVVDRLRQVPGVKSATPFIFSQAMLRSKSGISGAVLRGIDPEREPDIEMPFQQWPLEQLGSVTSDKNGTVVPGIVIGKELAQELKVIEGDLLFLTITRAPKKRAGIMPFIDRFRVVGIFDTGMHEFDASMAYIRLAEAQRLTEMEGRVTGIEIRLTDVKITDPVSEEILRRLGFPYRVRNWKQLNANLFSMLMLQKTVLFIILTLIILVAAFNIASALIMTVSEKAKDIAILRAMGARGKNIRAVFVIKGMAIGLVGTSLGLALGFLLCWILETYPFITIPGDVYFLSTLPVRIEWLDVGIIAFAALFICFISTLYPAWRASRMSPVDGIRYG